MGNRTSSGICTYCGAVGDVTKDHIPPQNLFPRGFASPYVLACRKCNGDASGDDEHFRAAVAMRVEVEENPVVQEILPAVMRGIGYTGIKGNTGAIVQSIHEKPLFSPAGIFLGMVPAYSADDTRMSRVAARTVRGLFFREFGTPLPTTHGVLVYVLANLDLSDPASLNGVSKVSKFAIQGKVVVIHKDVFTYAFNNIPDRESSTVWTMLFYGRTAIMCFTISKADYRAGSRPLL